MFFPLTTDAEQYSPSFINSLPIAAVCACAVPVGTAASITVAMDKSAHPEKLGLANIVASSVI
jgi:hypothetical protein